MEPRCRVLTGKHRGVGVGARRGHPHDQCTHGIDLLQWMMGEDAVRVQAASGGFAPIEAEDFGAAVVEFKSGAVGIIEEER